MTDVLVRHEVADGVAVLTLDNPTRSNAWSPAMEAEFHALLTADEKDPDVRVVVVTGEGRSFCPGMDAQALQDSADKGISTEPHKRPSVIAPRSIRKPIIAAINGACAGLGLVVAVNCDLRFASSTAKITTAFAHRGIMAEQGLAWSLTELVGTANALDLLLSARVVKGQEAVDLGLVNRIYEPEDLMAQTMAYARDLAANSSPNAMGVTKDLVYRAKDMTHDEARLLALRYWLGVFRGSEDFKEGIHSYLEKRPPHFPPWDPAMPLDPPPLPAD